MARGVNKVILIGNLGADPERRSTAGGTTVTTLRLATSDSWRDKQTGEMQERTEWHRIKLFGKLGDIAADYLTKGRQVYIEGSIRSDKYTGKDGQEKYFTEIIADQMQMLGGGGEGGSRGGSESGGGYRARPQQSQPRGASGGDARPAPSSQPASGVGDFEDDDIPF